MEQFLQVETLVIELLLVVSLVAIAVRRLRIPYTVALVVVGLFITFQSSLKVELTSPLILALFLPPLVFEAAFHINIAQLVRSATSILVMAVPGVILTTLIVAGLVAWLTPLGLPLALVFGALIAATDPVAVVALFRTLGVPKRLTVITESESLLNDGTAIVVLNLVLVMALGGHFDLVQSSGDFVRVAVGGTGVGLVLGWIVSQIIARVDDYLIETTLTAVLAFGAYLVAERLHLSGVLAVVAAGLVSGNVGPRGMSPTTRIVLFNFWETIAFLANSLVFLLIGLQVNLPALAADWRWVLVAIGAVLIARALVVYTLTWITNHWAEPIPLAWQHVLAWGGLRGAVSLALVLSLPATLGPNRELLQVMAFGVVLFTLLLQATTMRPLVRRLGIIVRSPAQDEYDARHARLTALRAADTRLERLHADGLVTSVTWERLKPMITQRAAGEAAAVRNVLQNQPGLEAEALDTGWREMLRAQRSALLSLRQDGMITEEVFEKLTAEVDAQFIEGFLPTADDGEPDTQFIEVTLGADFSGPGPQRSRPGPAARGHYRIDQTPRAGAHPARRNALPGRRRRQRPVRARLRRARAAGSSDRPAHHAARARAGRRDGGPSVSVQPPAAQPGAILN